MDYIKWLKDNLNEERYEHSLGVADKAFELAEKFGLDFMFEDKLEKKK